MDIIDKNGYVTLKNVAESEITKYMVFLLHIQGR